MQGMKRAHGRRGMGLQHRGHDHHHASERASGLFGGGGRGGHGGRRGKRFSGDELRLMVLGELESGPRHGYQLIRAFAELSGEAYSPSPGVLYPLLTMLAEIGLVEEVVEVGNARRRYALTDAGRAEVDVNRAVLADARQRLTAMADEAARTDAGPVRRAMTNLRAAAIQRLSHTGTDDELVFRVAALLDEAAQKIERL